MFKESYPFCKWFWNGIEFPAWTEDLQGIFQFCYSVSEYSATKNGVGCICTGVYCRLILFGDYIHTGRCNVKEQYGVGSHLGYFLKNVWHYFRKAVDNLFKKTSEADTLLIWVTEWGKRQQLSSVLLHPIFRYPFRANFMKTDHHQDWYPLLFSLHECGRNNSEEGSLWWSYCWSL